MSVTPEPPALLVVDDNEDDRALYRRALETAWGDDLRLYEAGSEDSALACLEAEIVQCVLLDYSLPGHNGIEILKRIRGKFPHLAVIMLTGQGNETIAVQSMKEGAQDYIAKSTITSESLQRVVHLAVEHTRLQKQVDEQRASLEIFSRALAHDLKEPMRTIQSFLERITDASNLSQASQQSFHYIRKAADRMNALIDTVHFYTKLEADRDIEKAPCNIAGVIDEVRENLDRLIQERNAVLTQDTLPLVYANHVQMIQLLQNLVANAIRHSGKNVNIHIGVKEHEAYWQFVVKDDGPGIRPEYLEKIFHPFKRASRLSENEAGLGLGLAINKKIVEIYGGKIWCESQLGLGSSFFFTLPKAPETLTKRASPEVAVLTSKPETKSPAKLGRILLIDDNEADITLNRLKLIKDTKLRCDLLTAYDGEEALSKLRAARAQGNPVDLILLDINIPGMTGFELIEIMKREKMLDGTLVVMCTTSGYEEDRRTAQALGAIDYLTKPPQFPELKTIIEHSRFLKLDQEGEGYALLRGA